MRLNSFHWLGSVSVLLLAAACTDGGSGVGGQGGDGAGGGKATTTTVSVSSSSGGIVDNCPNPSSVMMSVKLADGTSLPSTTAPSSTTTFDGTLHVTATGYSVEGEGGDTITVSHDAAIMSDLALVDGATVSLFVGYRFEKNLFSLRLELTDEAGDLRYFALAGEDTLPPPGGRVAAGFGKIQCVSGFSSGTGSTQQEFHEVDVTIDGAALGSFEMAKPATLSVGGQSFHVDNRNATKLYYGALSNSISVIGRAVANP